MVHRFAILVLAFGAWSCGGADSGEELQQYVKTIQQFNHYNAEVERFIIQFGEPSIPVTQDDVSTARQLVDDYTTAVRGVAEADDSALRNTHKLYSRAFDEATRLARDKTGDLKRQGHSVKIGLVKLRTTIRDRVYPSIEVLLARKGLDYEKGSEWALPWGNE